MAQPTIRQLRDLVRKLDYVVSTHAAEELEDDDLSIFDLESIILTGRIADRQRDVHTNEIKYLVSGVTLGGRRAQTVVKAGVSRKLVVITVYVL